MTPTDAPADFLTSPFERASVQWTADEETAAEVERLMAVWTRRTGRDLASEAFWEESRMRSRLRRDAAAQPSRLEQTRSAAASLVVAAVTAAAPAASLAHPGSKRGAVAAVNEGVLAIGSKGAAVASVQRALGVPADGIFGPKTRAAVVAFQKRHGLVPDGIVGPQTLAALGLRADGSRSNGGSASAYDGPRTSTRGARAARIALRYLGIPYRWGGASPSTGFDCSGFVMYVYAKVGVSLPHRAASQYGYGRPVSRAQLAPGDVVFFNRLGHNGIYLGKGRFIHAPHSGEVVKISSIWDSWYARTWVGARRL